MLELIVVGLLLLTFIYNAIKSRDLKKRIQIIDVKLNEIRRYASYSATSLMPKETDVFQKLYEIKIDACGPTPILEIDELIKYAETQGIEFEIPDSAQITNHSRKES